METQIFFKLSHNPLYTTAKALLVKPIRILYMLWNFGWAWEKLIVGDLENEVKKLLLIEKGALHQKNGIQKFLIIDYS